MCSLSPLPSPHSSCSIILSIPWTYLVHFHLRAFAHTLCLVALPFLLFTSFTNPHQMSAQMSPPPGSHPWSSSLEYVYAPSHCLSPQIECQLQDGWDFVLFTALTPKQCVTHGKSSINTVEGEKRSKGEGGREEGEQLRKIKSINSGAYSRGAPHTAVLPSESQLILSCGL